MEENKNEKNDREDNLDDEEISRTESREHNLNRSEESSKYRARNQEGGDLYISEEDSSRASNLGSGLNQNENKKETGGSSMRNDEQPMDRENMEQGREESGSYPAEGRRDIGEEGGASSMHGKSGAVEYQKYLGGVNYPAVKQDMIDVARSNMAPDNVMMLMDKLPERTYNTPEEVEEEFGKIQ